MHLQRIQLFFLCFRYQCKICEESFRKGMALTSHIMFHVKLKCPYCKIKFDDVENMEAHQCPSRDEAARLECEFCMSRFMNRMDLNRHIKDLGHTGGAANKCEKCQIQFPSQTELFTHRKVCWNVSLV